jgi:hypothetical protein
MSIVLKIKGEQNETTFPNPQCLRDFGSTVFDVEPFGHELKAEWLRRNEKFSVVSNKIN